MGASESQKGSNIHDGYLLPVIDPSVLKGLVRNLLERNMIKTAYNVCFFEQL
jgi:hypothetical protein